MRLVKLILLSGMIGIGLCALLVTENALRAPQRVVPQPEAARALAQRTASGWQQIAVTAKDGIALDGWRFTPRMPNGSVVIALHGVGDTRLGMLAHAEFLLRNGFMVLVPDSRGHGESGGG